MGVSFGGVELIASHYLGRINSQYPGQFERGWQEILSYLCVDNAKATCSREADDIKRAGCSFPYSVDEVLARP